jgi:hypothetical protein
MRRVLMLLVLFVVGCASSATTQPDRSAVDAVLDAWHRAAAEAKESDYFDRMAPTSIFFGTDATERWTTQQFRDYAHPFFEKGRAWTFHPRNRNVYFSNDGNVAWFDEALDSASYGEMRGTGVLQRSGGSWRIEQYNLTVPIPNDLAKEFVEKIRAAKK